MSWNIQKPGDYINGPLTVAGSATISGDLTVDTNVLKVDTTNNNVGIGTTTPASYAFNDPVKLAIANDGTAGAGNTFTIVSGSTGFGQIAFANGTSGTSRYNGYIKYSHSTNAMEFYTTAGALQATLNSTGLGVGAVPSGNNQLTVRSSGAGTEMTASFGRASQEGLIGIASGTNGFVTGSIAGDMVVRSNGKLMLFNNTANAGITIDTAANVGIGTTVTNRRLNLGGGASNSLIHFFNTATGSANTDGFTFGLETDQSVVLFNAENTAMKFYTNSNQNMTLDASGNLLVGTTSAGGNRLNVQTASGDCTTLIKSQAANVNSAIDYVTNYGNHTIRKSGAAVWDFGVINDSSATPAFKVSNASSIGVQLVSAATSWTALSDETMKDIIEPISNAVSKVGSLRSVIGKFKTDDSNKRRSFLIAQDVQSVLPEAVDVIGENNELGLRYTEVIPLLVAAIKELTAEVNALKKA